MVLLPNTPLTGAVCVAERIRTNVEKIEILHEKSLPKKIVTLSLGVATTEGITFDSHEQLIKQADLALYGAKNQGRNQVQFFSKDE